MMKRPRSPLGIRRKNPEGQAVVGATSARAVMRLPLLTDNVSIESTDERSRFAVILTLGFFVLVSLVNVFHEPWRDETQAWLLARDTPTLSAFFEELHRVGHPHVWYVLLRLASGFGDYWIAQVINLTFTTAAIWLLLRFAPFSRTTRALIAFGYLPLFEYGVIARNYAIGVFLLFLFTALFPRRRFYPWLLTFILAIAANTSLHAAIVAVGALALLVLEWVSLSKEERAAAGNFAFWFAVAIAVMGLLVCVVSIIPPPDFRLGNFWHARPVSKRLVATLGSIAQAFASVPWLKTPGVPSLKWMQVPVMVVGVPLSIVFVTVVGFTLARRKFVWVLAALPCGVLLAFFFDRYYGGARHAGFLLVAVLMALWLAPAFPERTLSSAVGRISDWANRHLKEVLNIAFAWHVVGAVFAVTVEIAFVFSAGRNTAQLIRSHGLERRPIVIDRDVLASSVIGYLGRTPAFFANVNSWGTYVVQDSRHGKNNRYADAPGDVEIFERARELSANSEVVVVLNHAPTQGSAIAVGAREIGHLPAQVYVDESFWVYLVPQKSVETARKY